MADWLPVGESRYTFLTAKERDTESNLDYFGARYFSGAQGRFGSVDPSFLRLNQLVNPQRWNAYGYAVNNPLKYVDPDGKDAIGVVYKGFRVGTPLGRLSLGHGGVVLIKSSGQTKYYEYGRYDKPERGITRRGAPGAERTPSVKLDQSGEATPASLGKLFDFLSSRDGQDLPIEAVYFVTDDAEDAAMEAYLEGRIRENKDPNRPEYTLSNRNCGTLICDALQAGKTDFRVARGPFNTPSQNLDRLQFLNLLSGQIGRVTYEPKKKKGERVTVTLRYDQDEN